MITGEPLPVEKQRGDEVIGGTVNQTGSFLMRAEKVGQDTVLSQIGRLFCRIEGTRHTESICMAYAYCKRPMSARRDLTSKVTVAPP